MLKILGTRLRSFRETQAISQQQLSDETLIAREQISRIENGLINPTIETIVKLSKALNVSLSELFGKTQLLDKIKSLMPPTYDTYYEPFLGGGALFFNLTPEKAVISDFNEELMIAYQCFKDKNCFELMVNQIIKHEKNHNETYYYDVRSMDRQPDYKTMKDSIKAARLIYLNKACFNGLYRVNSKGFFNVPSAKRKVVNAYNETLFKDIQTYFNSASIEVLSGDFEAAVKDAKKGDFVYFDPPYDTLEEQNNFTTYTKDAFGKEEQVRLSNVFKDLDKRGVFIMLSNHNTPFIQNLYKGFNINVVLARRSINSKGDGRGAVEEVIITNYSHE